MPTELDEQRRKIMQMEIEEAALKKETDKLSARSVWKTCRRSWQNSVNLLQAKKLSGITRKHSVENLSVLREKIENMNKEIEKAQQKL